MQPTPPTPPPAQQSSATQQTIIDAPLQTYRRQRRSRIEAITIAHRQA